MSAKITKASVPPPPRSKFLGQVAAPTIAPQNMKSTKLVDLNFKVDPEFHRSMKVSAASAGISIKRLLEEAYDLWLKDRAQKG